MKQNKSTTSKSQRKEPLQPSREWTVLLPLIVIAVVTFLIYYRALTAGFILDDYSQVLKNHLIRDLGRMPEIFLRSAWVFEGAPPTSNYYRPMLNMIYMFTYYFFGYQAWGFHLVNVLFHTGNAVLVFFLVSTLHSKNYITPPNPLLNQEGEAGGMLFPPFGKGGIRGVNVSPFFCRPFVCFQSHQHRGGNLDCRII